MKGLRLYKKEKLCSPVAIDMLFAGRRAGAQAAISYPLRAVWRSNPGRRSDSPVTFLISVPKKRLRHAVDRVAMRRRVREAYRLARPDFPMPDDARIDLAFVYVADKLMPYASVDRAVRRLMEKVRAYAAAE
ncbi:MAG: ribonuclease P protein component [Bacteroides sp.]|nr:ribonuclease P protein component [Bacteroides sp.]